MDSKNEIKCQFCGETINKHNQHHIKKCIDKYVSTLSKKTIDNWKHRYLVEGYSMIDMVELTGLKYSQLQIIFKKLDIPIRNVKEASSLEKKKLKYENTCLEHYGVKHNFDKNCQSRKDWEKRLLEEEGIVNVFQRQEVKDKILKTNLKKYGVDGIKNNRSKGNYIEYYIEKYGEEEGKKYFEWVMKRKSEVGTKEYYVNIYGETLGSQIWANKLSKTAKGFSHNNGLNKKCQEILYRNNITYTPEFALSFDSKNYIYDFKIYNDILIELNGDYWHCSPTLYKPNDTVIFPGGKAIKAKDKWEYDNLKRQLAENCGYKVLTIWEHEFNEELLINKIIETNERNKN